jgi:YD repeat-containing protein
MAGFSRRSFFGGVFGILSVLFGTKGLKAAAATPVLQTEPVAPSWKAVVDPFGFRTTCVYDGSRHLVSVGDTRTTVTYSVDAPLPQGSKEGITCKYNGGAPDGRVEPSERKLPSSEGSWRLWREGAD